jgi:MSHA biogenesis protein MshJ
MKALWVRLSARFAALARRERVILAAAAVLATLLLGDRFWLTPNFAERARLDRQLAAKRDELGQLTRQIAELNGRVQNAEANNRASIDVAKRELADVSARVATFERTLVPPQRMAAFLQGLLPAGGALEVVSLKTLPPEPLVQHKEPDKTATASASAPAANAAVAAPAGAPLANLYKHGVELRLAGSYQGLLDYLSQLENAPQKVLWGRLELKVVQHPRCELVITLYTLSLDASWLIV